MTFQALLLIAAAGGILRMLLVRPFAWCTRRSAIFEGRVMLFFSVALALALIFLESVLLYRLSLWQPQFFESRAFLTGCALYLGWHLSANLVNSVTLAFLVPRDLTALEEGHARLKNLLEKLPPEVMRLDGDQLVLLPIVGVESQKGQVTKAVLTAEAVEEVKREGRWKAAPHFGFELHYPGGILRQELGETGVMKVTEAPRTLYRSWMREAMRTHLAAVATACDRIEAEYPGSDQPTQGPPRSPLLVR